MLVAKAKLRSVGVSVYKWGRGAEGHAVHCLAGVVPFLLWLISALRMNGWARCTAELELWFVWQEYELGGTRPCCHSGRRAGPWLSLLLKHTLSN